MNLVIVGKCGVGKFQGWEMQVCASLNRIPVDLGMNLVIVLHLEEM